MLCYVMLCYVMLCYVMVYLPIIFSNKMIGRYSGNINSVSTIKNGIVKS